MTNKITKTLLSLCMCFGLVGCSFNKEPELNADRGTDYKYDFAQFLDAELDGSNGHGFLIIKPKELEVSDFESEEEYITIKKAIDGLKLTYDPDEPNADTYLEVSPSTDLSNGDIVTLSIGSGYSGNATELSINTEPYQFEIKDLSDPKELDIFDTSSLALLALNDGTNSIYPVKIEDGVLTDEMLDQINYTATTEDSKPQVGKTIINVTASIVPLVDEDNNPLSTSLSTWFGKQGYVIQTEGEKVLREFATTITFTEKNKETAAKKLYTALKEDDPALLSVANIQQVNATNSSYNPYVYTVTYYSVPTDSYSSSDKNSAATCKRASVRMGYSKSAGVSVLELISSGQGTNAEYCSSAYTDMSVKAQYIQTSNTVDMTETTELTNGDIPEETTEADTAE